MLSAWLELVNMSIQSYSIQTFHIFSLNRATMSAGDRLHHKQRSQMWSKLTNIFCDKNPFIIHPTPPPQIPTITTDQTKTYENNMYLIYIYISLQYHVRSLIYQRMSLLSFFLGFAMQSLNVSREAPRPGWCPGFSLLPLHVAPIFLLGTNFEGCTFPFSHVFCWVAICWVSPSSLASVFQHPNLTSTSSKVDWSWSSGAQVLPKTSAVESRRPTAWKDGWFLFFGPQYLDAQQFLTHPHPGSRTFISAGSQGQ